MPATDEFDPNLQITPTEILALGVLKKGNTDHINSLFRKKILHANGLGGKTNRISLAHPDSVRIRLKVYSHLAKDRFTKDEIGRAFQTVCGSHDEFIMDSLAKRHSRTEIEKLLYEAAMKELG